MKPLDINLIKWAISELEAINPADTDATDKAVRVFQTVGRLPSLFGDIPAGTRLCRARLHWDDILFDNVSEIGPPPQTLPTKIARCNKQGNRIFYCSEDRETSYRELVDTWSDNANHTAPIFTTIGAWYTLRSMRFLVIPSPYAHLRISRFDKGFGGLLDSALQNMSAYERPAFELYHQYLFYKFSQDAKHDKHPYIVTSTYSEFVLAKAGNVVDGIIYPSVKSRRRGLNFAIRTELITPKHVELRLVHRDRLRRVDKPPLIPDWEQTEYMETTSIDFANNNIQWTPNSNTIVKATFNPSLKLSILRN